MQEMALMAEAQSGWSDGFDDGGDWIDPRFQWDQPL